MAKQPELKGHLLFVADLSAGLRELQERSATSAEVRGRFARWRERAAELEGFLRKRADASAISAINTGDISDIPPELLKELSIAHVDPLEAQVIAVLQACGGRADLDQILIGLYRKFETVQKRRRLAVRQ